MLRPAPTVMSAYYRRRGEDRVTEVFSAVLNGAPQLLHSLLRRVGLSPAHIHEIRTQVRSGNVTIDLEIVGCDAHGTRMWVLWSEHKVHDPLTARQLEDESNALALRAQNVHRQLMAVTLVAPRPDAVSYAATEKYPLLRWQDISKLARQVPVGRAEERIGLNPSVGEHLLNEWLDFAKNELEAPVEALTPERVALLPEANKTLETLEYLRTAGFTRACAEFGAGTPREVAGTPRELEDELHADAPKGSWLEERGFTLYAKFVIDGGFGDVDEPCLVVGGWIEGDDAVSERRNRELLITLPERGLSIWDEHDRRGGWIEFAAPLSLCELATHVSIEEQVHVVEEACLRAFRTLIPPAA